MLYEISSYTIRDVMQLVLDNVVYCLSETCTDILMNFDDLETVVEEFNMFKLFIIPGF